MVSTQGSTAPHLATVNSPLPEVALRAGPLDPARAGDIDPEWYLPFLRAPYLLQCFGRDRTSNAASPRPREKKNAGALRQRSALRKCIPSPDALHVRLTQPTFDTTIH